VPFLGSSSFFTKQSAAAVDGEEMQPRSRSAFRSLLGLACVALGAVPALVACEASSSPSPGGPTPIGTGFDPGGTPTATASPTMTAMPGTMTPPPDPKSWGPAVEISSSTPSDLRGNPQVGIDAAGNAVAVWLEIMADRSRNAIWASRYTAGGAWTAPATIDQPVGNVGPPALAITATGTALVAFQQSESNQGGATGLQVNRFTGAWSGAGVVSSGGQAPQRQAVALGTDGAATVVFQAADAMYPRAWAVRSTAAGAWGGPGAMGTGTEPGWAPAVTVSANGDAVMTWTETGGGPSQTSLWASRNRAGVWEAPALLSTDTGTVENAILVGADANGNTLALWSQRLAGIGTIRSARLDAATGAWSAPVTVSDGLHDAIVPNLGVNAAGDAVAIWAESTGVVASRFVGAAASWAKPVVVQGTGTGVSLTAEPIVGLDAKGNAVASWVQSIGSPSRPHLFAAHLAAASGSWAAPNDLVADPSAVPYPAETQVSVNAKGEAIVVWHQETDATHATGIWARVYR
jgi:hypothetical protein